MSDERWRPLAEIKDGRNIDAALGGLTGEAAQLVARHPSEAFPDSRDARQSPRDAVDGASYYNLPLLKEPVWTWTVPLYFYVGGAAGASSLLAAALTLAGRHPRLARRARWLGAAGDALSAGLLIYDLGRPTRFLNMLRVFRPSSPMSVGSWILSASGATNSVAALLGGRRGFGGAIGTACGAIGGALGAPLAGYTAVLLSTTAVPVWQQSSKTMPLLFMASGVAAAASALELLPATPPEARALRRFAIAGKVGELLATRALCREAGAVERVARPLNTGASGALFGLATALTGASLVASLVPGGRRRRLVGAIAGTLGSMALRFAIVQAGRRSARDPHATLAQQQRNAGAAHPRARLPAAE